MRHKKSGLQIGEENLFSDSKIIPQFPLRISHLQIQIPTNYNHPQFKNKSPSTNTPQNNHNFLNCVSSSEAKEIALKLLKFSHVKLFWLKLPPRLLILLCLPSIYIFSSHHYTSFSLYILFIIAFSGVLLSSFNLTPFHPSNLPSILARNLPILNLSKSESPSQTHPQVVWSIGSNTLCKKPSNSSNSGFLVKVYSNGDVYEGEFYKGRCSGSGVYYYNMNGRYEGDWVDQKYDGFGVETWAKGSRYRGQYRQGLRHGYGVYRFYIGGMYAGEWFKGQCHGCGVHSCEDGSKYVGEFKGGVKHGLGHYHFRNGDMYAGEYFADKMHGFGVYRFANGHRYDGAWHEGGRQGFGMYTFRNGDAQSGHWENGVLSVSTAHNTFHPGSSISVSHAKVLKVVQDARCIAEKAVCESNVDEKVNRAVMAANKAANAARVASVKAVQNQMHQHDDTDN